MGFAISPIVTAVLAQGAAPDDPKGAFKKELCATIDEQARSKAGPYSLAKYDHQPKRGQDKTCAQEKTNAGQCVLDCAESTPEWAIMVRLTRPFKKVFEGLGSSSHRVFDIRADSRMEGVTVAQVADVVMAAGEYQNFVPTVEYSVVLSETGDKSRVVATYTGPDEGMGTKGQWMIYRLTKTTNPDESVTITWEVDKTLVDGAVTAIGQAAARSPNAAKIAAGMKAADFIASTGTWTIKVADAGVRVTYIAASDFNPQNGDTRPCVLITNGVLANIAEKTLDAFKQKAANTHYATDPGDRGLHQFTQGHTNLSGCPK